MRSVSKLFCLGLALTAIFTTSACSYDKKEDSVSGDLAVQVPVYSEGKYQLSIFNLTSMTDLVHLSGASARLLMDPHIFKNQLRGRPPELQYIRNSRGVIVPTDFDSLQLLTIYSQFEKLHELDKSLGVDTANKWPVTVAVNVHTKNSVTGGLEEDNAFYTSQFDAYLFAPYSQDQLPLMVNGGVIAHEHFHSLYQHLVIDPLKDKYPDASRPSPHDDHASLKRFGISEDVLDDGSALIDADQRAKYHSLLLHGVNEGLADVWGWIYTGDENFVGRSLSSEAINRNLALPNYRQLFAKDLILRTMNAVSISQLGRVPYDIGTQLARTIKTLMQKHYSTLSDAQVRKKMAELVIKTLPVLRDRVGSLKTDEYLSLTDVVTMMASQIDELSADDCQFLNQLIPSSDRPTSYRCGDVQ